MPSQLQTETARNDEILTLKQKAPVMRSSVQSQAFRSSRERVSSAGENITTEHSPYQHASVVGRPGVGNSGAATPSRNRHKPWPRRKATGEEEVVKYMSIVPSYLQPPEKGDNVQDKALNFGVLDWGRLEKWTYLQKQVGHRRPGDSPSCSTASSSPFSTSGSSSHSDRSIGSPLAQTKQSPTLVSPQSSSSKGRQTRMMGEQNSVPVMITPVSRSLHDKVSIGCHHEKRKTSGSKVKSVSCDEFRAPEIGSSSWTGNDDNASAFSYNKEKVQGGGSREAANSQTCEKQSVQANLELAEKELLYQFSVVEGMWDHLQESFRDKHISDASPMKNRRSVEISRSSFCGAFPPSDILFSDQPPRISYSCPLSSTSQRDDPAVASVPLSRKEMLNTDAKGKLVKLERFADLSEKVDVANKSSQAKAKVVAELRRDLSPQRLLRAGLNRIISSSRESSPAKQRKQAGCEDNHQNDSATNRKGRRSSSPQRLISAGLNLLRNSSSREGSMGQKMKETVCTDNSHGDNSASNIRSRRSPLRRILDPLRSKSPIPFPGPITSLPSYRTQGSSHRDKLPIRDELQSANGSFRSSDSIVNRSANPVSESGFSVQAEKLVTPTRQALLKLAWKSGYPLFVFSSSDINILAATMEKRSMSHNDFDCIYTIFTAHEIKKKSGVWTSQANKNKKQDLVYNVVGQLKVSSSESTSDASKNYFLDREFVLYGGDRVSSSEDHVNPRFKNELAAIVVRIQSESLENDDSCNRLQSSGCRDSSHTISSEDKQSKKGFHFNQRNDSSSLASVVAILPSGAHGTSSAGEPSPLIDRWKSGGACDCGGWDEGCMLTVLRDKSRESTASERPGSSDRTHQIELFTQVETKETTHAFSMITFKEGVYTVDFGASISSLQAFAMCIATLHSRKAATLSGFQSSVEAQISEERTILQDELLASYVPEHPPLSPVGRA